MFAQIKLYKNLIGIGAIILALGGLYFYIGSLKTQIDKLEIKVSQWQVKYTNEQRQSDLLRNSVKNQNDEIERLRLDEQAAQSKLSEWEAKPPVIKYKTITKVREVKSSECPDIKTALEAVRQIDFDNL